MPRLEKGQPGTITFGLTILCPKCQESEYFQPATITDECAADPKGAGESMAIVFRSMQTKFLACPRCEMGDRLAKNAGEYL